MKTINKENQINEIQELVIESYEARKDGSKDYTLDEAFEVIEKDITKQSIYSR